MPKLERFCEDWTEYVEQGDLDGRTDIVIIAYSLVDVLMHNGYPCLDHPVVGPFLQKFIDEIQDDIAEGEAERLDDEEFEKQERDEDD